MELFYRLENGKISVVSEEEANFIVIRDNSKVAHQQYIMEYELPSDIFDWTHLPYIAPRYERIPHTVFGETLVLVLANIDIEDRTDNVEKRLESITFLLGNDKLVCFIDEDSTFDDKLQASYGESMANLQSIIIYGGILIYKNFTRELAYQKDTIDLLDHEARTAAQDDELEKLADTERDMVILQHALDTQRSTFTHLFNNEDFVTALDNKMLIYDIRLYNRQVNKLVHVYRDLLDTVGGLFSDIMSNRLNVLMKILSSLSILIAIPSLIGSIWGMNTGGLPFANVPYGTVVVLLIAIVATALTALWLKKNDL